MSGLEAPRRSAPVFPLFSFLSCLAIARTICVSPFKPAADTSRNFGCVMPENYGERRRSRACRHLSRPQINGMQNFVSFCRDDTSLSFILVCLFDTASASLSLSLSLVRSRSPSCLLSLIYLVPSFSRFLPNSSASVASLLFR